MSDHTRMLLILKAVEKQKRLEQRIKRLEQAQTGTIPERKKVYEGSPLHKYNLERQRLKREREAALRKQEQLLNEQAQLLTKSPENESVWKVNTDRVLKRNEKHLDNSIKLTAEDMTTNIGSAADNQNPDFAILIQYLIPNTNLPQGINDIGDNRYVMKLRTTELFITRPELYPDQFDNNSYTPEKAARLYNLILEKYPHMRKFYIQLYKNTALPQEFHLFDSINSNCVMEIVQKYLIDNPDHLKIRKKTVDTKPIVEKITTDILNSTEGFTLKHLKRVRKELHLDLVIKHNKSVWSLNTNDKCIRNIKKLTIFAHDKHASEFKAIQKTTKVVYVKTSNNGLSVLKHMPTRLLGYPVMENDDIVKFNITAYKQEDTIFKSYRPPWFRYDQDPRFFGCTNKLQFEFKKWKLANHLRAPTGIFYDLIKASDHVFGSQELLPVDSNAHYLSDINKAYPSFQSHPMYNHYKLPLGFYNLGIYNKSVSEIVSLTGWSQVTNIKLINNTYKQINFIQDKCIYPHPILANAIINNHATFDIVFTIVSKPEHIEFPFIKKNLLTEDEKQINNSFVGNLIVGNKKRSEYFTTSDSNEFEQILYDAKQDPNYISGHTLCGDLGELCYNVTDKPQLYNIHSYILAYSNITMVNKMIEQESKHIISYHTDGFYTIDEPSIISSTAWGEFKVESKVINYRAKQTSPVHKPSITPEYLPNLTNNAPKTLTNGYAGCGKTASVWSNTYYCSKLVAPTNNVIANHKESNKNSMIRLPLSTYQKHYSLYPGAEDHPKNKVIYENMYVDEVSMIKTSHFNKMKKHSDKYRYNLHLIGDVDNNGLHQLEPVSGNPLLWKYFEDFKVTKGVAKNRRQNPEDCIFLDNLHDNVPYQLHLDHAKLHPKIHVIRSDQVKDIYDETSTGIVASHARAHLFNMEQYNKLAKNSPLRLRSLFNFDKQPDGTYNTPNGSIFSSSNIDGNSIWFTRTNSKQEVPKGKKYELGYFNTCHAVQGAKHEGKLFIDTIGIDSPNWMYTAITRCTKLENVYLIVD